ncbi:MAG: hypothetical protein ABSA83_13490 [Verrucomicrobiota bacterium]
MPDLLLEQAEEPHVGSIDVDLALDVKKLAEGLVMSASLAICP